MPLHFYYYAHYYVPCILNLYMDTSCRKTGSLSNDLFRQHHHCAYLAYVWLSHIALDQAHPVCIIFFLHVWLLWADNSPLRIVDDSCSPPTLVSVLYMYIQQMNDERFSSLTPSFGYLFLSVKDRFLTK